MQDGRWGRSSAGFVGPLTFAFDRLPGSTLSGDFTGVLDLSDGGFRASSASVRGSGALQAVTGALRVEGTEDLVSGDFTERVRGRLCAPLPGRAALESAVA